ncbi:MAG: hypothetical protein FJ276_24610 [Planctomycetes bacterium]|nr:hypothetical protein [Planctomycetota bacterium]
MLSIKERFAQDPRIHVYDDNHLVGAFPHNPSQLEVLQIPWDDIRASLAQMRSGGPALLGPSQPVSIHMELGPVRGNQQQVVETIQLALVERLARDSIRAEPGHPTYFRLRLAEEAGDQLPIYVDVVRPCLLFSVLPAMGAGIVGG